MRGRAEGRGRHVNDYHSIKKEADAILIVATHFKLSCTPLTRASLSPLRGNGLFSTVHPHGFDVLAYTHFSSYIDTAHCTLGPLPPPRAASMTLAVIVLSSWNVNN